ncbi:uncharacterized protein BX664DRAFT_331789 [Halteromyces radiatus]|uniref:uncharacterized protein n=1 Tax=Halteromyces radiatus TaxID=101107 RepID=UPI0022206C4E|nr:uncharacterized protein BX664DRAFT_331789 [Halteromyces radiatus]KAI8088948.1 hypothetical protein BX664DRAFT_331789 [Halteromyces radiatus]
MATEMKQTVVHLPPRNHHSTTKTSPSTSELSSQRQYHKNGGTNAESHQMQHYQQTMSYDIPLYGKQFLVSDTLYFEVPQSINDNDIVTLLTSCRPILIQRNKYHDHIATGWIRFINKEQADRAYTLFDGLVLKNSHRLQLYITPDGIKDQVPCAPIFQVTHLPLSMTNDGLYNLFRPFGPIRLCKIIVEKDSSFTGMALLQYFYQQDADNAKNVMDNKLVDGRTISIYSLVSNKPTQMSPVTSSPKQQQSINKSDQSSIIDYTNLYIKNLDLSAKSADLYNAFRSFGRIISARVMKNPRTKQSRGYGFVSFCQPEEAREALEQFNGKYILSKPVVIAYHEPKRLIANQSQKQKQPTTMSSSCDTSFGNNHQQQQYHHHMKESSPTSSLVSTSTSASFMKEHYQQNNNNNQSQRDGIRAAILKVMNKEKDLGKLENWVDSIMSLRSTSRALCLFNPAYLVNKLEEVASSSPSSFDHGTTITSTPINYSQPYQQYHHYHQTSNTPKTPNLIQPDEHHSHASSATTTSSAAMTTTTSTTDIVHMHDLNTQDQHYNIARLVESIKGLSLLQQKQRLGDILFPHVKATGVKKASRVTIQLLDTQPLDQLAYSMHSMELLKPLVEKANLALTKQETFMKAVIQQ